jgi:hypothetical protein
MVALQLKLRTSSLKGRMIVMMQMEIELSRMHLQQLTCQQVKFLVEKSMTQLMQMI